MDSSNLNDFDKQRLKNLKELCVDRVEVPNVYVTPEVFVRLVKEANNMKVREGDGILSLDQTLHFLNTGKMAPQDPLKSETHYNRVHEHMSTIINEALTQRYEGHQS